VESLTKTFSTITALLHSSIKVTYIRAPHTGFPVQQRAPRKERRPYPANFRKYLLAFPVKELLPRPPPRSLFKERGRQFIHRAPFILLKVPSRSALPQVPQSGAPMRRDAHLQSLFYISLRVPSKGSPHSRFPSQSPTE